MTNSNRIQSITPDDREITLPRKETSYTTLGQIAARCATLQDLIDAALKLPVGQTLMGKARITPEDAAKLLARPMTPAQAEEQRRSFAYGNTAIENPLITREMIDKAAKDIADA